MTASPPKSGWRLEPRAAALERFLDRRQILMLAIWSLVYFAGTMLWAHGKPFWYDEILTVLEARQPNLSAEISASGDMDWMPPANHLTFYLWNKLAGSGEVAFRIPVMIGFWVFCICLYLFARRRAGVLFAWMAMLLPFTSAFQTYSYEARSYAFMLAFCGLALVSWQAAADKSMRPWSLIGLALGIAAAISFQYWAVLIYLPLAGAEAYRSIRLRRVDWSIWAAFAAGGLALLASLFLLLHGLTSWTAHGGKRVHPGAFLHFYSDAFRLCFAFAVPAALMLAAWFVCGGRKEQPEGVRSTAIPGYEWVAVVILLLIPLAVVSIALAVPPHAFWPRYAAPAIAGYALLASFLAAQFAGKRASIGVVCVLAALAPFLYFMTHPVRFENPFRRVRGLQQQLQDGPVVVEDLLFYMKIWYYTPDPLKPRLLFLAGKHVKGPGAARSGEFAKLGVPVVPYNDFALPGKDFLFYSDVGRRSRLQKKIVDGGGTVETLARSGQHILMRAHVGRGPSPLHSVYFMKTDAPETASGK